MQYTHTNVSGAVQRSCSLLQTYERSLKRGGGRCVGGEIKPPKNVHCSCSLLQTHEKELEERRRVGSNIPVPGVLCVLGWYRSRFKCWSQSPTWHKKSNNVQIINYSIVRDQRTVVVSLLQPQVRTSNTPRTAIAKDCCWCFLCNERLLSTPTYKILSSLSNFI